MDKPDYIFGFPVVFVDKKSPSPKDSAADAKALYDYIKYGKCLPCPFCGGAATVVKTIELGSEQWQVRCDNSNTCPVSPETCLMLSELDAINLWNTRNAPDEK